MRYPTTGLDLLTDEDSRLRCSCCWWSSGRRTSSWVWSSPQKTTCPGAASRKQWTAGKGTETWRVTNHTPDHIRGLAHKPNRIPEPQPQGSMEQNKTVPHSKTQFLNAISWWCFWGRGRPLHDWMKQPSLPQSLLRNWLMLALAERSWVPAACRSLNVSWSEQNTKEGGQLQITNQRWTIREEYWAAGALLLVFDYKT